jgi:N-acetylmuramoyl-L-alanine amidase
MHSFNTMQKPYTEPFKKRITSVILALLVILFVGFTPEMPSGVVRTVVIDAGHGGSDPGNLGTGRYRKTEKDITLDIALRLGAYIEEHFPGLNVVYTRKDDSFPTLKKRVEIANSNDADLFISIHCDAFTKPSAKGSSTFVMGMHKTEEALRVAMKENAAIYREENYRDNYSFDPSDPDTYIALTLRQNTYLEQSLHLSSYVQREFRERVGRVDRGVKQAGFYVISFTTMPSILIETGFLTNPDEEDFLNSEAGRIYIASAIFRAFRDYKNELDHTEKATPATQKPPSEAPTPTENAAQKSPSEAGDWRTTIRRDAATHPIHFQVQVATSSERIAISPAHFNGITEVDEYFSDGFYKYAVGLTPDFNEAKKMQELLRSHGFDGAFVIAFKNGDRIAVAEAIKQLP